MMAQRREASPLLDEASSVLKAAARAVACGRTGACLRRVEAPHCLKPRRGYDPARRLPAGRCPAASRIVL